MHVSVATRLRPVCSLIGGPALVAVLALALAPAPPARANGDPASDVLLGSDVYLPFSPAASNGVAKALLELTRRTRADGWPIKVAIIATPDDLGDVPNLFDRPQAYADFLAPEIGNPRLLVVTPLGFGGEKLGRGVDGLSRFQPVQPGDDGLERQALTAIAQLAAAGGHRVATPTIDTSATGRRPYRQDLTQLHPGSPAATAPPGAAAAKRRNRPHQASSSPFLYIAPIGLVLLLLAAALLRDRLRTRHPPPDDPT